MISSLAGCALDPAIDDADSDTTTQAIAGLYFMHRTQSSKDLGSDDTQSCLLLGVRGSMQGYGSVNGPLLNAAAGLYRENGRWILRADPATNTGLFVRAACYPSVGHRTTLYASENDLDGDHAADLQDRHCFMKNLQAHGFGMAGYLSDFPFGAPGAALTKPDADDEWSFGGKWNSNADGSYGGTAGATCFDIPTVRVRKYMFTADNHQVVRRPLLDAEGEPLGESWMCGMTGVFGVFLDSPDAPGADVFLDNGVWTVEVADRREIHIRCVK